MKSFTILQYFKNVLGEAEPHLPRPVSRHWI